MKTFDLNTSGPTSSHQLPSSPDALFQRHPQIALSTEKDLEEHLERLPSREMLTRISIDIITEALREATNTHEIRDILVKGIAAALQQQELKEGLKELIVGGLSNSEIQSGVGGIVGGVVREGLTAPFRRAPREAKAK